MAESNGSKRIKTEDDEDEDRISSLHDNLISDILSFLPINNAVATSILSHRWKTLWTQITRFSYDVKSPTEFSTITQHIFPKLDLPNIHIFRLSLPSTRKWTMDEMKICSSNLKFIMSQICSHNVQQIEVTRNHEDTPRFVLPSCVFETASLVVLQSEIYCQFPKSRIVNLPNLIKLSAYIPEDPEYLCNLLKNCPNLQDLSLKYHSHYNVAPGQTKKFYIAAPNLTTLAINVCSVWSYYKFVIDVPNLKHLTIRGRLVDYQFVENPTQLYDACISVLEYERGREDTEHLISKSWKLFQGLANIKSLQLKEHTMEVLKYVGHAGVGEVLPIFHNLTHLKMNFCYRVAWKELTQCISSFPNLEVLILSLKQYEGSKYSDYETCTASKLRYMEVRYFKGYDEDIVALKHILEMGIALEQLVVCSGNGKRGAKSKCDEVKNVNELLKEYESCERLFKFPWSSLNCAIVFNGYYMTASS
ncbi:unnamed protein product [Amaranthus hypochondriacus]